MIGVWRERSRSRMRAAVSNPSMPDIFTSIRIMAKSWSSTLRSASGPEEAFTRFCPSSLKMASRARRLPCWSSTINMFVCELQSSPSPRRVTGELLIPTARNDSMKIVLASGGGPGGSSFTRARSKTVRTVINQSGSIPNPSGVELGGALRPHAQHREHLFGIGRLGDVIGGARVEAALAVALHRLGRKRDDGQ